MKKKTFTRKLKTGHLNCIILRIKERSAKKERLLRRSQGNASANYIIHLQAGFVTGATSKRFNYRISVRVKYVLIFHPSVVGAPDEISLQKRSRRQCGASCKTPKRRVSENQRL